MSKCSLTSTQVAMLSVGSAIMFPYTFLPVLRTPPANQDAWIVMLLSLLYIILFSFPLLFLVERFKGHDLVEINQTILGKIMGNVTSIFYMLIAVLCFVGCMALTVEYVQSYVLLETPQWVIILFIIVPLTYASQKGAGTIGRLAVIVVPMILLTIVFFFCLGLKDMKIDAIKPIIADSTLAEINKGAFLTAARYSEVLVVASFAIHMKKKDSATKAYFKGVILFGLSFFIITISVLLLLGSDLAKIYNNPFLIYCTQVGGENMFQRVQILNILAWFVGTILKLTIFNYIATYIFARVINKKSQKVFVIPLSVIAFALLLIPFMRKMSTLHLFMSDKYFPFIIFSIIFGVSMILFITYMLRMKKIDEIIIQKNIAKDELDKAEACKET